MELIFSASILAAFLAGMVALFAPCCITVLLPAYLASAFREKKNIIRMTLLFFLGIAVVLIPIGLGAAWLASIFQDFHKEMYLIGGTFMIILAIFSIFGKSIAMIPMLKNIKPKLSASHPKSVFLLGILSGAATSCCAPVLAGAVTLAVVSGAFWKALIVTFAYVFGMVFPLFLAAYFYDKFKLEKSKIIQGKVMEFRIRGKDYFIHSTNLLAAGIFFLIGITMVVLGFSGDTYWAPGSQVAVGNFLNRTTISFFEIAKGVPEIIWAVLILGLFGYFIYRAVRKSTELELPKEGEAEAKEEKKSCH
ncbi:MAG: cytochrome c bioproteinis protein, transmembrane region [Parcubacteria group bacterium Gr01-1014_20]|nr:MAG: cytochrome c bioproteinis protein, transmembrane region [Parcubacteria group bacterium Gr01-1014_20]